MPRTRLIEIYLWFCADCGVVQVTQWNALDDNEATMQYHCPVCNKETTFSPVAIEGSGYVQFMTRIV